MKECYLQQATGDYVQCLTCRNYCRIGPFKRGLCGVRENQKGKLFLLNYGRLIAENIENIEKKPFKHFLPNTKTLSIAQLGCNLDCMWCQNAEISQGPKQNFDRHEIIDVIGRETEPQAVIEDALKLNLPSISYTYTEPTVFLEFALDTMKLARKNNLKNLWVSNGYMSEQAIKLILPELDAINIDLKAFDNQIYLKYTGASLTGVLSSIEKFHNSKTHLELTTLIVPGVNDDEKQLNDMAKFIHSLSHEIPWHVSRFFPAYKATQIDPTPHKTLEKAYEIGKKVGLKHIYIANY